MSLHGGTTTAATATSVAPAAFPLLAPDGTNGAPSYSFSNFSNAGWYAASNANIRLALAGALSYAFVGDQFDNYSNTGCVRFGTSVDTILIRDAAGVLAVKNGDTAQEFRVYGACTGTKYAALSHNAAGTFLTQVGGNGQIAFGTAALANAATSGFICAQSTPGPATGTPASIPTGQIPFVVNSITGQVGLYNGGWTWLPKTLQVDVAAVGNINTGTDDLISYTMPANVLATNNKTLRIRAWGTTANNVNTKQLTLNWGSQVIVNTALTTSLAGLWETEAIVTRTGGNTQDVVARTLQGATLIFDQELTSGTQTDTAQIIIKMTGTATTTNDIVQEGLVVEVIN